MGASSLEIWQHGSNIIQRSSYGVNGKKQYKLQMDRMINMSCGGTGGDPNNTIMSDTSKHEGSIRQMHFSNWTDDDFHSVLKMVNDWETTGKLPPKPTDAQEISPKDIAVDRAYAALMTLDRDEKIDALNDLAARLGVLEPDEDSEVSQEASV